MNLFRGANVEKRIPPKRIVHRKISANPRTHSSYTPRNMTIHPAASAPDKNTDTTIPTNWPPSQRSAQSKTTQFQALRHRPYLAERRHVSIRDDSRRRISRVFARQFAPLEEGQHHDRDGTAFYAEYSAFSSPRSDLKRKQPSEKKERKARPTVRIPPRRLHGKRQWFELRSRAGG